MAKKPSKFEYLRNWSQVILECIPSRSGMSMGVYVRGERVLTVGGCGFDCIGTALGVFLETLYSTELNATLKADTSKPLAGEGWFACQDYYGAYVRPDGTVSLDGGCGESSMRAIAEAIGLEVTRDSSRTGSLLIITKKGK